MTFSLDGLGRKSPKPDILLTVDEYYEYSME